MHLAWGTQQKEKKQRRFNDFSLKTHDVYRFLSAALMRHSAEWKGNKWLCIVQLSPEAVLPFEICAVKLWRSANMRRLSHGWCILHRFHERRRKKRKTSMRLLLMSQIIHKHLFRMSFFLWKMARFVERDSNYENASNWQAVAIVYGDISAHSNSNVLNLLKSRESKWNQRKKQKE